MHAPTGWSSEVRDAVLTPQPAPTGALLWTALAAAVLAVTVPWVWPRSRAVLTIAHEGAHAFVAVLAGRRLRGIRLHSDTSGLTVSQGRASGPGMVATLLAGYLGPGVLGLAAAFALSRGYATGLLWGLLVVLALLLVQIRNLYGLWVLLVAGAAVFATTWWAPVAWQVAFATAVTAFLLLGAPRPVLELQAQRRRGQGRTSDADQLAGLTRVPGIVWVAVFLAGTVAAALAGGWMLAGWAGLA